MQSQHLQAATAASGKVYPSCSSQTCSVKLLKFRLESSLQIIYGYLWLTSLSLSSGFQLMDWFSPVYPLHGNDFEFWKVVILFKKNCKIMCHSISYYCLLERPELTCLSNWLLIFEKVSLYLITHTVSVGKGQCPCTIRKKIKDDIISNNCVIIVTC